VAFGPLVPLHHDSRPGRPKSLLVVRSRSDALSPWSCRAATGCSNGRWGHGAADLNRGHGGSEGPRRRASRWKTSRSPSGVVCTSNPEKTNANITSLIATRSLHTSSLASYPFESLLPTLTSAAAADAGGAAHLTQSCTTSDLLSLMTVSPLSNDTTKPRGYH
jgi:hypothetical protein